MAGTLPLHLDEVMTWQGTTISEAASREWDVAVVGAGPAGGVAALEAAASGCSVLLIEKKSFPRYKVCGCCLNRRVIENLREMGLGPMLESAGATPIERFDVRYRSKSAQVEIDGGLSLSRSRFDAELAQAAMERGAVFLPETKAELGRADSTCRSLTLTAYGEKSTVRARVVIAADGLGGRLLSEHDSEWVSDRSLIGAGTLVPGEAIDIPDRAIVMAMGRSGYVGLVRIEGGLINVAAALSPKKVKESGIAIVVQEILSECNLTLTTDRESLVWKGTSTLTRQSARLGSERVFVVGDAAGYIEPFTGQGISWAVDSARNIQSFIHEVLTEGWRSDAVSRWERNHVRAISRHQRLCRHLSWSIRSPFLMRSGLRVINTFPGIAAPFTRRLGW